jgi:cytochrome c oxidase assembly protein subunit 11
MSSQSKNHRVALWLLGVSLAMFGFGYALVPLYQVLCKATGLNGKTGGPAVSSHVIDKTRTVTVEFVATGNANMAFQFYPQVKKIKVHPGENTHLAFFAKNDSAADMIIQAIPSVSPGPAARHLKKTECFCFTRQYFKPFEQRIMPILFHVDTDLPKNIGTLTLSYTLFDVSKIGKVSSANPGKIHLN